MKVLIATVGTRGDIQPYIGLSLMLMGAGHTVTIATSRAHEQLLAGFHVPFHCIDETKDTSDIQKVLGSKGMQAVKEGVRLLFDGMLKCHDELLRAAANVELVIGHGWLGEVEAQMCRKRFIRVGISPNVAEKVKTQATSIAERMSIAVERLALNRMIIRPYNEFLRKVSAEPTDLHSVYEPPLFLPISRVLLGSTHLWNSRTYQSSYWYADTRSNSLPSAVTELLSNGRKNVLLNFGSMTSGLDIEDSYIRDFYGLADELDYNLIWVGPHAFSGGMLASERFVAIEEIPLSSLLPKMDVAIHHCGLGTTSEVIRSGCPSVPVPFAIDQHDWAKRLVTTGAATKPIKPGQLTEGSIRERLMQIFENREYEVNAHRVRDTVLQEIEGDETIRRIERICAE